MTVGGATIDLAAVDGIYLCPAATTAAGQGAAVVDALWAFSEISPATVLNRPAAMGGNGSKPFQSAQALVAGFRIPENADHDHTGRGAGLRRRTR